MVGHLFSLVSVVQAVGRLRPTQRTGMSSFVIFANTPSTAQLKTQEEHDMIAFQKLLELGVVKKEHKQDYIAVATLQGLWEWEQGTEICQIAQLASKFNSSYDVCHVCDVCCRQHSAFPVQQFREQAVRRDEVRNKEINDALLVVVAMKERCLVCGKTSCRGDGCLKQGCFNCGGNHYRRDCQFSDFLKKHYQGKRCFKCLDMHERQGYESHAPDVCPIHQRLKRLLIFEAAQNHSSLQKYMVPIYTTRHTFMGFLAKYKNKC